MPALGVPEAWRIHRGGPGVIVAIIDNGFDLEHPDLAPQLWTNGGEVINGFDDDGNGYVDDVHGWDFLDGDADVALETNAELVASYKSLIISWISGRNWVLPFSWAVGGFLEAATLGHRRFTEGGTNFTGLNPTQGFCAKDHNPLRKAALLAPLSRQAVPPRTTRLSAMASALAASSIDMVPAVDSSMLASRIGCQGFSTGPLGCSV
jgi:subtilisin family serine protease